MIEYTMKDAIDNGDMSILGNKLHVCVDRGTYLIAEGSPEHLTKMGKLYYDMLGTIVMNSGGSLDGPDVLPLPETNTFRVLDYSSSLVAHWSEELKYDYDEE